MRTWIRARVKRLACGNCRTEIAEGAVCLELKVGTTARLRCQTCGESMFGEQAPELPPLPVKAVQVPQPPAFSTLRQLLDHSSLAVVRDARMRQAGEEG